MVVSSKSYIRNSWSYSTIDNFNSRTTRIRFSISHISFISDMLIKATQNGSSIKLDFTSNTTEGYCSVQCVF